MKKILFMLSSMNIGGVEKSFLSLISNLPKDKYDITLLLLEKKGEFLKFVPDWIKVEEASWFKEIKPIIYKPPQFTVKRFLEKKEFFRIPGFLTNYYISKYFNNRYFYYKQVMKEVPILNQSYDIAIAYHGPTDIIDFYIINKVNANNKISWVHFDISQHYINKKLYKKLYKEFDQLFIVSQEAENKLIKIFPDISKKVRVVTNHLPHRLIRKMAKENVVFDEKYNGFKIVTVGRLSKEKGQDIAVKVLSMLRKNEIEVRWYCIGDGKYKPQLEKLIEEYDLKNDFKLLGSTTNPYPFIANADLYVQPSRHEGYCLTLAEAKCLNKPIVTTTFTGASEQIQDGFNGLICGLNEKELFEKISFLIANSEERLRLSRNLSINDFVANSQSIIL